MSFRLLRTMAWTLDLRLIFISVRSCQCINKASNLKSQLMCYKSKAEKFPPRRTERIHLEMCNLSAGRLPLWFIIARLFAPPTSLICFKYWRQWICPRDWMSSGSRAAAHASQCVQACVQSHLTHTQGGKYYYTIQSPRATLACMQVFVVTGVRTQWSVFPMRCVRAESC